LVDSALASLSRRLPTSVSRDDLSSVGKLALISALAQVEGTIEEIRAYCFVRVRGAMLDELRRLDPLSRGRREKLTAVIRAQAELSARFRRAATRAEIVLVTKFSIEEVSTAQATLAQEALIADLEWNNLPDTEAPSPVETAEIEDLRFALRTALSRLGRNQAEVLHRYYFEDATLDAIAADLGLSKERVRQIREAGEKKLRADFVVLTLWQSILDRA
jgi:RNA polymerase sigma factor for flagellar operon FliA